MDEELKKLLKRLAVGLTFVIFELGIMLVLLLAILKKV